MTRILLITMILFIVFLTGVITGRMINNRLNRRITRSRLLMETYDVLIAEFVAGDIDISTFFKKRKVIIYGLRGKYGHDFFSLLRRDLLEDILFSDGNADVMQQFKGRRVYDKRELKKIDFDYLIILPLNHFDEICEEFKLVGIESEKICSIVDVMYYLKMRNTNV